MGIEAQWRARADVEETILVTPLGTDFAMEVAARHREWFCDVGYEPLSTDVFRRAATSSDVIIDIGAHIGWYSIAGAGANPSARVIAVEGSADTAAVCRGNCERVVPGRVEVLSAVFTRAVGTVDFHIAEATDNSSLSGHPGSPTRAVVRRPAISGDSLDVEAGSRLLVKVDVEGHERDVLAGLASVLGSASSVRMLVELNPQCLSQAGTSAGELLSDLRELGFAVYRLDDRNVRWSAVPTWVDAGAVLDPNDYANLYCVRGEDVVGAAICLHTGSLGGAERTALEQAELLVSRGFLVHAYVPGLSGGLGSRLRQVGATVSVHPSQWWVGHDPELEWTRSGEGVEHLIADMSRNRPDVVMTVSAVIPCGAMAARALRIPHVWSVHEFVDLDHGFHAPSSIAELGDFIRRFSTAIIVNSAAVGRHLLPSTSQVYTVIPPMGATSARRIQTRTPSSGPPREIGVFSALNPGKGQRELIAAFSELAGEGRDLRLHIFGAGSPEEVAHLQRLAEERHVQDRVVFEGHVADTLEHMAEMDLVVMPSQHEAFGRVPVEAVLVGRPVVYCRGGGMDDFMVDGVTGVSCEPNNPADLARALRLVIDDASVRAALGGSARSTLVGWLEEHDVAGRLAGILIRAKGSGDPNTWAESAMARLVGSAAEGAVRQASILEDRINVLTHDLDLLSADREAVDSDRMRLHREWERARGALAEAEVAHARARGERDALQAERDALQAEWDALRASLRSIERTWRFRAAFGWRQRLRRHGVRRN